MTPRDQLRAALRAQIEPMVEEAARTNDWFGKQIRPPEEWDQMTEAERFTAAGEYLVASPATVSIAAHAAHAAIAGEKQG